MLYPHSKDPSLDLDLFKNPGCEYRGTPLWSWNTKLEEQTLTEQISELKEMGFGGYHIHPRIGLSDQYLGDTFMKMVKHSVEEGRRQQMLTWLYDEDRWPSGYAGGMVTEDTRNSARFLRVTPIKDENNPRLIARYDVCLDDSGRLKSYKMLNENETAQNDEWFAYICLREKTPWFNNQSYANLLDKKAVERFVEVTHERYKEVIGKDFGGIVPAIFTDEPQFSTKTTLPFAKDKIDVILSWTDDVPETFGKAYHFNILEYLPEIIWNLPDDKPSFARYAYHEHIAERFASAFADTCGNWCKANNLMLTGHVMREPKLSTQTPIIGEAMRSYRSFDIPGIDMLGDAREFTTAKQAQSAAHQYGCPGVMSELYGVTNWDFDFRGHKLQGDWQAALGITVRVPHLTWMTMAGEAKRDFPASIGYQSPWYKEYSYIEDHFARVNTAMTRGTPSVRIGVIHPIESFWLNWGPNEHTADIRREMDTDFENVTKWLLSGFMDFDFIAESLLPEQCPKGEAPLKVGAMNYDAVVVPNAVTLRQTTVERLKAFAKQGGRLIFMGKCPTLIDAKPNNDIAELINSGIVIANSETALLRTLDSFRLVDIRTDKGERAGNLLYQMRNDNNNRWLFIAHAQKPANPDTVAEEKLYITINGSWMPTIYDTITGKISKTNVSYENGKTVIYKIFNAHDSLLLLLEPGKSEQTHNIEGFKENTQVFEPGVHDNKTNQFEALKVLDFKDPVDFTLEEPNALLLDMAEYRFDNGSWNKKEEILRIDNLFRQFLGYPLRTDALAQPYVVPDNPPEHNISLRFTIQSEIDVLDPMLAAENPEKMSISLNDNKVSTAPVGWFCDKNISTVKLPAIKKGTNTLMLTIPFSRRTNIEWCYILGDFGVTVNGGAAYITAPLTKIGFGDIATQGLPFYGGNLTYHLPITSKGGDITIEASMYKASHLQVKIDGKDAGKIAFAPYCVTISDVPAGNHMIDIVMYGTRINAFGSIHNSDVAFRWFGPNAWRTTGKRWGYEYNLHKVGILKSPVIYL
ncbi:MAG: glycosyl hydrolase [Bacillota bacterium]|nr:glycosyl hydrolase [Bacillota bacterium]